MFDSSMYLQNPKKSNYSNISEQTSYSDQLYIICRNLKKQNSDLKHEIRKLRSHNHYLQQQNQSILASTPMNKKVKQKQISNILNTDIDEYKKVLYVHYKQKVKEIESLLKYLIYCYTENKHYVNSNKIIDKLMNIFTNVNLQNNSKDNKKFNKITTLFKIYEQNVKSDRKEIKNISNLDQTVKQLETYQLKRIRKQFNAVNKILFSTVKSMRQQLTEMQSYLSHNKNTIKQQIINFITKHISSSVKITKEENYKYKHNMEQENRILRYDKKQQQSRTPKNSSQHFKIQSKNYKYGQTKKDNQNSKNNLSFIQSQKRCKQKYNNDCTPKNVLTDGATKSTSIRNALQKIHAI